MFILRKADWSQYASEPILPDDSEYESTGDARFEDDSTGDDRSRYDDDPSNSEPLGGGSHREDQPVDDDDDGAESVHTVAEDDQQESSTEEISVLDDRQDVKPAAQKKRRRLQPPMVPWIDGENPPCCEGLADASLIRHQRTRRHLAYFGAQAMDDVTHYVCPGYFICRTCCPRPDSIKRHLFNCRAYQSVKAAKPRTGILRVKGVPPPEDYKHLFEGVTMLDAPRRGQSDVSNRVLKTPVPSPKVAKPSPTKHRTHRNRKT